MIVTKTRCNRCGAHGAGTSGARGLKAHHLRAMDRERGWKQRPGGVDLCPLCWPLVEAEERFKKERRA